jgi:hypothetical protein
VRLKGSAVACEWQEGRHGSIGAENGSYDADEKFLPQHAGALATVHARVAQSNTSRQPPGSYTYMGFVPVLEQTHTS